MSIGTAVRPLSARPSLEYERKEAKALLGRLRAGHPESLTRARAQHPALPHATEQVKLADAQLVVAREYGFASWPRLVRYFKGLERRRAGEYSLHPREIYESRVRSLIAEHAQRHTLGARAFAAFVPRFYGLRRDQVFAMPVMEDDARLAVARMNGLPSWQVLMEEVEAEARTRRERDWGTHPMEAARDAIRRADLATLQQVVAAHPRLLHPEERDMIRGNTLLGVALHFARERGDDALDPILGWLSTQGPGQQHELNVALLGYHRMSTDRVRELLDRGADPNWIAPNGFSVLEHAIVRWWNGEATDVVARRATPRGALWVAAGLGDVEGVARFLDRDGKPVPEARADRPDFTAMSSMMTFGSSPDADDEEVLMEAFLLAMFNDRTAVMEYMASRGCPVNSLLWGAPLIKIAVGNGMASQVECLLRCGADLDLRGPEDGESARELARDVWEMVVPKSEGYRRVAEMCGHDPDAILAEKAARPKEPPGMPMYVTQALRYAGDDAFQQGYAKIGAEHLLFGLLRAGSTPVRAFTRESGMDGERFREDVALRLFPTEEPLQRPALPFDAEVQDILREATALAVKHERDVVYGTHVLRVLLQNDDGVAARWLSRYGGSAATLRVHLDSAPRPHGL